MFYTFFHVVLPARGWYLKNFELGVVFWGSYIKYPYTIGVSIPYFPIVGFVKILKSFVVKK